MWVFELETLRFLAVNDAAVAHYGYSREEFLAMTILDIRPDDDRAPMAAYQRSLSLCSFDRTSGWRHRRKNGTVFQAEVAYHDLEFEGRHARIAAVTGVTVERRAQEELRRSERYFRSLIENSSDVTVVIGEDRVVRYASPSLKRVLGHDPDDLLGRDVLAYVAPEDRDGVLAALEHRLAGAVSTTSTEFRALHVDGTVRILSARASRVDDPVHGGIVVSARDVTSRRTAEAERDRLAREVETERARLSALLTQAPAFICTVRGPEHRFEMANALYHQLIGHRPVIGRTVREALPEIEEQGYLEILDRVYRTGQPHAGTEVRLLLRRTPGAEPEECFVTFVYQPIHEPDGTVSGIFVHGMDVTVQVRARQAVEQLASERAAILEQLTDGVIACGADGRITYLNAAAERMTGTRLDGARLGEYGGVTLLDMAGSRIPAEQLPLWRALRGGEAVRAASLVVRRGDGHETILEVSAAPVRGEGGEKLGAVAVLHDVTERHMAEAAIRQSEARYERIAGNVPGMVYQFALHPDGTLSWPFVSEGSERIYGVKPEEIRRHPTLPFDLVDPTDREALRRSAAESAQRLTSWQWSGRIHTAAGEPRLIHCASRPQRLADGTMLWEGVVVDVTEQRAAEEEIRFQSHLLESVQQAVIATGPDGRVVFWNRFAEELYGWPAAEAAGKELGELLPLDAAASAWEADGWEALHRAEESWEGELQIRRRNGTTVLARVSQSPLHSGAGERVGMVTVSSDVTGQRHLEAQLRQSQKMEAVGRLAGGVAHDFNNLLTAIQGNTELLLLEAPEGSTQRDDLLEIRKASQRAAALTRQLLAFSRRQVLQLKVLDLNATIQDLEKMLRRLIGEDIELATYLDPALGPVRADPGQLEQALVNLAVNARDAMPTGGTLSIETSNVRLTEAHARRFPYPVEPGEYVQVMVSDTGVGMTEEVLAQVFEPFFTTKPPGKGTGLGLSMVYGVVKQSGGYVWADSRPRRGASFRICLPRAAGSGRDRTEETPLSPARGRETILLVEDDDAVRTLARRILLGQGYSVLEARDGEAALEVQAASPRPVDLVLSDVVMPRMSGRELRDRLARQQPGVRVLFMSGYTDDALEHHGVLESEAFFVEKPFTPQRLASTVREALDGGTAHAACR
jgi:PAS domain S-box-containing protein